MWHRMNDSFGMKEYISTQQMNAHEMFEPKSTLMKKWIHEYLHTEEKDLIIPTHKIKNSIYSKAHFLNAWIILI